jgi:hypothetical protein
MAKKSNSKSINTAPTTSETTESPAALTTLQLANKRFKDSWDYAKRNWHEKWDRDNALYDNERYDSNYEGTTDTFVPMVFSTIETMVAALSNAAPRFEYKSGNPIKKVDPKAFNALVEEWWDQDQWDLVIEESYRETLTTGMTACMLSWDIDHPHIESFSMRDAIIDPTIKNPSDLQQEGAYAGRRFYVRKGTLDSYEIVDTDEESETYGELIKRYKSTRTDTNATGNGEYDDKTMKEMFGASTLSSAKDDQDEIIEIWTIDRVVTMKNRNDIIEDVENPYKVKHRMQLLKKYLEEAGEQTATPTDSNSITDEDPTAKAKQRADAEAKGVIPYFFFRNYRKLSLFYATSEINAIAKSQELLNDMTNMETDYIIRQLAPQKELDPQYNAYIDLVNNDPDTVYPFVPGSLVDRQVPVLPPNSFNNRMNIKNEIRETTAIDQVAKGAQNVKDTTATEVKAQLNQSGQRIESKARIYEKDGFYWLAWLLMKMAKLYINEPIIVEVAGSTQDNAETSKKYGLEIPKGCAVFDPKDYDDDFRPRVTLDVDSHNNKVQNQTAALEMYKVFIADPTNNLEEVKRRILPKAFDIDQDDLDAIMTQPVAAAGTTPTVDPTTGLPVEAPPAGAVPVQPQQAAAQGVPSV